MRVMFDEVRNNKIKSYILLSIFIIVIGFLGAVIGLFFGSVYFGLSFSIIISLIYTSIVWYSGDQMILRMSGAREVTKKEYPYLFHTIEGLAIAANIPAPKAYVIDDSAMNAFATGRDSNHASITVTTGLLKVMNRQELEGVIAHEMSHIKNYDIRFMMLAAVLVGIITLISDFILRSYFWGGKNRRTKESRLDVLIVLFAILLAILSPIIGELIKLAISRKREYMADASAVVLTRYPPGLASALRKIAKDPDPLVDKANKATAHLFISKPFRQESSFLVNLFSTHPPIHERIKRLEGM